MEEITLTPAKASKSIEACYHARRPVCLWGSPGLGKSATVQQTAARLNLQCRDVRAVQLDPVDLRGLPYVTPDGRSHWAIPEFLPREGSGLLFLDEINRAPQMVQNACFQLVQDRKLGDYTLPNGWNVAAACNRESDGGGVTRMSSGLSSRFLHINFEADLDDWCTWAIGADVDPLVIAFQRFRPELFHSFDRSARSFPCPRTWHIVSDIAKTTPDQEIELALVAGAVGQPAAIEYMAFARLYRSLPSIDAILLNPTQEPVPTETAVLYAVSAAMGRRANDGNFARVLQYLKRLPAEFNVMAVRDAIGRTPRLKSTPDFNKWAIQNANVTM